MMKRLAIVLFGLIVCVPAIAQQLGNSGIVISSGASSGGSGSGTVTSVTCSTNGGLTCTANPITTSGSIALGTNVGVPGYTSSGATAFQFTGNANNFYQLSLQNTNSGSSASSDFVVTADDGNDSTHYADFGINNSAGAAAPFTAAHAAYTYTTDGEFDIGALGTGGVINFYSGGGTVSPTSVGSITSTGLNSMAVGVTTASTGKFTTLQATSTITFPSNSLTLANLPQITANTILGNNTGSTANIASFAIPSCSAATSALTWTTSTGFGCNTISGGSGTVNSGTSGQLSYYASTTNAVSGNANATISNGALTLGQSTGPVGGSLIMQGATSGATTIVPTAVAGSTTATLPANTGTIAELNLAQTWTAVQTYNNSTIKILGSSTGANTLTMANAGASNFTTTIPAVNGTVITSGDTATVTLPMHATQSANTVVANVTASTASPTAATLPSCTDTGGNHLNYTNGTGFSCGTSSSGTTAAYIQAASVSVLMGSFGGIK